jgi:hypothetical protein
MAIEQDHPRKPSKAVRECFGLRTTQRFARITFPRVPDIVVNQESSCRL